MKILIVDNNPKIRGIVKKILIRQLPQIEVFYEVGNGKEAYKLYSKYLPDWVLMDIEMEIMDGLTAARKILKSYPHAKIIIISQYDSDEYYQSAQEIGACCFINKEDLYQIPEKINNNNQLEKY